MDTAMQYSAKSMSVKLAQSVVDMLDIPHLSKQQGTLPGQVCPDDELCWSTS